MNMRLFALLMVAALCVGLGTQSNAVIASPIPYSIADTTPPPWSQSPGDLQLFVTDQGPAVTGMCPTTYGRFAPTVLTVHVKVKNSAVWSQSASPPLSMQKAFSAVDLTSPGLGSPGALLPSIPPTKSVYVDIPFHSYNTFNTKTIQRFQVTVNPGPSIAEMDNSLYPYHGAAPDRNNTITVNFMFPPPCGPVIHVLPSGMPHPNVSNPPIRG